MELVYNPALKELLEKLESNSLMTGKISQCWQELMASRPLLPALEKK